MKKGWKGRRKRISPELKQLFVIIRRYRVMTRNSKKQLRRHTWQVRAKWLAFEKFHKRELASLDRLARRLRKMDRRLYERERALARLEQDAKLGRMMDNAKSLEELVRVHLGEKEYGWLTKKRAGHQKQVLVMRLGRERKRAAKKEAVENGQGISTDAMVCPTP